MAFTKAVKPASPILRMGHPLRRGLVFALPIDRSTGLNGTVTELVSGRTATPSNGADSMNVGSPVGRAYDFNGSTQKISFGNIPALNFTGDMTVATVCRYDNAGLSGVIDYSSAGSEAFSFLTSGGTVYMQWYNGGYASASVASYWTVGEWVVALWTFKDGGAGNNTVTFYKGGTQFGSGVSATDRIVDTTNSLHIAWYGIGSTGYMAGRVADVKIWNRVLTPAEIRRHAADPFEIYRRHPTPEIWAHGTTPPAPTYTNRLTLLGVGV